jgi:hypothetical protein
MMKINGTWMRDEKNRRLILRGCNLGDSSAGADFTGRPFPLEEAERRFAELVRRGFTFVRLVITWEALEHEGPGIYDESYLAYLRKLLLEAEKQGISVFIDPHQDVRSRFTGGDGAQDRLQTRYIEAMAHCRRRLKNCKALVGWGIMSEPLKPFMEKFIQRMDEKDGKALFFIEVPEGLEPGEIPVPTGDFAVKRLVYYRVHGEILSI